MNHDAQGPSGACTVGSRSEILMHVFLVYHVDGIKYEVCAHCFVSSISTNSNYIRKMP